MRVRLVAMALAVAVVVCGCSGRSDDRPKGPPLEMTHTFDKPSSTGALASPIFKLSGRATKFEFTQEPAKGFERSDLKRTTVYLVSTDSAYGNKPYESLKNGDRAEDLDGDGLLFSLSMDEGDTFGKATMEVEKGNAPFDLTGSYRLFVQTDHGVVTARVSEMK